MILPTLLYIRVSVCNGIFDGKLGYDCTLGGKYTSKRTALV